MSHAPGCKNPVMVKKLEDDKYFNFFVDFNRTDWINQVKPYSMELELTNKCAGSCAYCYAKSTIKEDVVMPKEKVLELVDQAQELGCKTVSWCGGDPLLHPDWLEVMQYTAEKGMGNNIATSALISKQQARQIMSLGESVTSLGSVGIHISSIVPAIYNKVHTDPSTLEKKMQGYRNILEAGFPSDKIWVLITYTKPVVESIEETLDWYIDEMGARSICIIAFKTSGFGQKRPEWEPSLSEVKKAVEYRAKKLGQHWLRFGASDGSFFYCRTQFGVKFYGGVVPCTPLVEMEVGNVYEESLIDIMNKHRSTLLYNHDIKGFCGESCENRDICFGCRLNAFYYTGEIDGSDPKCFINPDAKEYYLH